MAGVVFWTVLGLCVAGYGYLRAGGPTCAGAHDASGPVGLVSVFGQLESGPTRLVAGRVNRLPRPQRLAFDLRLGGTGRRDLRLEVDVEGATRVVFEETFDATVSSGYLEFLLPLDERTPDRILLRTVIEAPHDRNLAVEYPIHLVGRRRY